MPHFDPEIEEQTGSEEAEARRARTHLGAGRRLLDEGNTAHGISTLYDAMLAGLRWYAVTPEGRKTLGLDNGDGLLEEREVYDFLAEKGVISIELDMEGLEEAVAEAIDGTDASEELIASLYDDTARLLKELGLV